MSITERNREVDYIEVYLGVPPSANEQYIVTRKRRGQKAGKALSEKAKLYRAKVKAIIGQHLDVVLGRFPLGDVATMYELEIEVLLPELENQGWYETISRGPNKGKRKAETRFKEFDDDNRIKFMRDAICRAMGMPDDRQIFKTTIAKREHEEGAKVVLRLADESQYLRRKGYVRPERPEVA